MFHKGSNVKKMQDDSKPDISNNSESQTCSLETDAPKGWFHRLVDWLAKGAETSATSDSCSR